MPPERDSAAVESMVDQWLSDETPGTPTEENVQGTPDENTQGTPDGSADGQPHDDARATTQETQPAGEPGKPAGDKERQPQQVQKAGPGDLVDREGRIIAKAGAERRHYEAATRFRGELETTRQQLQQTRTELDAFRTAAQMPTQLGLTPDESVVGLQLAASWKANPAGVIQYLVEQAKAQGHNIDTLGGATDVGAIKQIIANELAPFRQQAEATQQRQQFETAAQSQVQALVNEYGEAALANSDALAKLINAAADQGRQLNLEQAWLRFSNWCLQNGYNPEQPIDPQLAARRQPTQGNPPANGQRLPPRPNGRAVASPNGVVPMDAAAQVSGNEQVRDLVRASMREAGFNV